MASRLPATGWIGLTVDGIEVAGNDYARQSALFVAVGADDYATNAEAIVWPAAYPFAWGLIDGVLLYDDQGVLVTASVPVASVTVDAYAAARIRPGGLIITRGASVGWPYGTLRYGTGLYARLPGFVAQVLLELTFARFDPCVPGVWTPADACQGAAWEPVDLCQPGTWGPATKPLRRLA